MGNNLYLNTPIDCNDGEEFGILDKITVLYTVIREVDNIGKTDSY